MCCGKTFDAIIIVSHRDVPFQHGVDAYVRQTVQTSLDETKFVVMFLFNKHFYLLPIKSLNVALRNRIDEEVKRQLSLMNELARELEKVYLPDYVSAHNKYSFFIFCSGQ